MNRIITVREFIDNYLLMEQHITVLDVEDSFPYFVGTVEDFYNENSTAIYHGAHLHYIDGRTNIFDEHEIALYI